MVFSSLVFVLIFLPLSLAGYYLVPKKIKNLFLLFASLVFYSWGGFHTLPIFLASIFGNYLFALAIEKTLQKKSLCKFIVIVMLSANIGLLVAFKYLTFMLKFVNRIPHLSIAVPEWALPLGISFFTFSALSYVLDVYFEATKAEKNILNVALYISFFPKLISGPLMQWSDFHSQLENRKFDFEQFTGGLERFIVGFAKKTIIADSIALFADLVFNSPNFSSVSVFLAWFGVIAYLIQLYFDFSGYSDMAVGLGKMFGFTINENFNYPYVSKNITEFWGTRWHISLGTWVNHYIYTPVFRAVSKKNPSTGKKLKTKYCDYIALIVSWCIIGPWHGAGLSYLAYGLYFCALIFFERLYEGYKKNRKKAGKPIIGNFFTRRILPHIYVFFAVSFGFLIFRANSLSAASKHFMALFGLAKNSVFNEIDTFYFAHYILLTLTGVVFSMPVVPALKKKLESKISPLVLNLITKIILLGLLIVSISFAVGNTYKAFIYFNF